MNGLWVEHNGLWVEHNGDLKIFAVSDLSLCFYIDIERKKKLYNKVFLYIQKKTFICTNSQFRIVLYLEKH